MAVGTSRLEGAFHLTVLRFESSGAPDLGFGHLGSSIINFGVNSYGRGLAIQPDGKIVVVGNSDAAAFAVARIDTDGNLDPSFGTGGIYNDGLFVPRGDREAWDVGLLSDGKIVVVGSATLGGIAQAVVFRLMPAGYVDKIGPALVGGNAQGYTAFYFDGNSRARGVALTPDARIMVVGEAEADNGRLVYLAPRLRNPVKRTSRGCNAR